jgi:hypothetical protein
MRTKKIVTNVQQAVGDPQGLSKAITTRVYYWLNIVQRRICDEANAVQEKGTITLVGGTELYDFPSGFISEIALVAPTNTSLQRLTMKQVGDIKTSGANTDSSYPLYFYKWGGKMGIMSATGTAPTDSGTLTIYYWRTQKDDGIEDISDSVEPIVPQRWDTVLELGATAFLTKDAKDIQIYEMEFARQKLFQSTEDDLTFSVPARSSDV